jgi:peptidoglycan hydrolase FlgJ
MALPPVDTSLVADPTQLAALKRGAREQTPESLREAARQFEGVFTNMLLKSMRDATPKDSLFGSDQQDFYTDLFDQQLAASLSKGKGLGLADLLVRQLMQGGGAPQEATGEAGALSGPGPFGRAADGAPPSLPPMRPATTPGAAPSILKSADRQSFIDSIRPVAEEAGRRLGVAPEALIAHAALETGWGRSMPTTAGGECSNNLFGIKAGGRWRGEAAAALTTEYDGLAPRREVASFRAYATPADSVRDYAELLAGSPRYAGALGTGGDVAAFGRALQAGGYATDPDYANKLVAVARDLKFTSGGPINVNDVTGNPSGVR